MSDRFQEKYRIPSARLRNWDYGWNGIYFITICTAGHDHYLGVIENKMMVMSEIGLIAQSLLLEIPVHFAYIQLDTFVIMPNHVHGIIVIQKPDNSSNLLDRTEEYQNLPNDEIIDETGII
jgi:REP element-mobilizing transposase RayT